MSSNVTVDKLRGLAVFGEASVMREFHKALDDLDIELYAGRAGRRALYRELSQKDFKIGCLKDEVETLEQIVGDLEE